MTPEKKKIFWFEDDAASISDCIEVLRSSYEVIVGAHDGLIKGNKERTFDLVILDMMIHMTSFDYDSRLEVKNMECSEGDWRKTGLEFLKRIRAGEYEAYGFEKKVPVLVATGVVAYSARKEAENFGIHGFLEKPFSLDDLEESVKKILTLRIIR
ncbi:MAG: response regulator [Candidatus Omnitrophota bacterium]